MQNAHAQKGDLLMKHDSKKRRLSAAFLSLMLLGASMPVFAQEEDVPSREIHVVYDDSGSMYYSNAAELVDRWSKAKYSMEVFASMLGPSDQMDVYYMSDYSDGKTGAGPRLSLYGSDSAQENVDAIHNEKTSSKDTPFETVMAARDDLEESTADEKWLVVLTDGDFQFGDQSIDDKAELKSKMDEYFADPDDVNVIFLAIGDDVVTVSERPNAHIYCEVADDSSEILDKVTQVSNRIFNANKIDVPADTGKFTLDVPMSELTVFVQGEQAQINGLVDESSKAKGEMSPAVTVSATKRSDNDAFPNNEPDSSLHGQTAVFDGPFEPGSYTVEASGASTIEVYFKPELDLKAYLIDESGNTIENFTDLKAGEYTIHFDLVSGLDGSDLPQKNIISQSGIEYEAVVTNNGKALDPITKNDTKITLEQGSLDIDVTATFLRYNKEHDTITNEIFDHKDATFTLEDENTPFQLGSDGFADDDSAKVIMKINGEDVTESEWAQISDASVTVNEQEGYPLGALHLEKSEQPGVFILKPAKSEVRLAGKTYEDMSVAFSVDGEVDGIPWTGQSVLEMPINDTRNWFVRHMDWILGHLWMFILGLLVLVLGILYAIKKRLPKVPEHFEIRMQPKDISKPDFTSRGTFKKVPSSLLIPAVAQEADIRLADRAKMDAMVPAIHVRALGSNKMEITNASTLLQPRITIDGKSMAELTGKEKSALSSLPGADLFGSAAPGLVLPSASGMNMQPAASSASSKKKQTKEKRQKKQKKAKANAVVITPGSRIVIDGRENTITLTLSQSYKMSRKR